MFRGFRGADTRYKPPITRTSFLLFGLDSNLYKSKDQILASESLSILANAYSQLPYSSLGQNFTIILLESFALVSGSGGWGN